MVTPASALLSLRERGEALRKCLDIPEFPGHCPKPGDGSTNVLSLRIHPGPCPGAFWGCVSSNHRCCLELHRCLHYTSCNAAAKNHSSHGQLLLVRDNHSGAGSLWVHRRLPSRVSGVGARLGPGQRLRSVLTEQTRGWGCGG